MRTVLGLGLCMLLALGCAREASDVRDGPESPPDEASAGAVARELFEEVEQNPADPLALRRLAVALRNEGLHQQALPHFEKLAEIDPSTGHLVDLARCYASISDLGRAAGAYQRALRSSPDHAPALYGLGNIALARGELPVAIDLYRRAIEGDPEHLLAYHNLGSALKQAGQHRQAYRSYERVLELEPTNLEELAAFDDSLYRLALLDLEMGATERAAEFLELFLESVPNHPEGHYAYGQVLTQLGRTEEAEREFETHRRLTAED